MARGKILIGWARVADYMLQRSKNQEEDTFEKSKNAAEISQLVPLQLNINIG